MSELPRLLPEPTRSGYTSSFDGTRIYWELHEPGRPTGQPPLVFCYGLVCSMNQWRVQVTRFRESRSCLLLDYRGHHKSGTPKDKRLMNISAMARDVAAAVREVGFKTAAHVWGHSLGCNVALEYALAFPDQVRSLVIMNGTIESPFKNMFGTDLLDKIVDPLLKAYAGNEDVYHTVWSMMLRKPELVAHVAKFAGGFNADASTAEDIETYARAVIAVSPETFFPLIIELTKGTTAAILPKIKTPALVLAGGKDKITPPHEQRIIAEGLEEAIYLEIPTGSHNVQLDFGDYVNLKAEEFWKQLGLDESVPKGSLARPSDGF